LVLELKVLIVEHLSLLTTIVEIPHLQYDFCYRRQHVKYSNLAIQWFQSALLSLPWRHFHCWHDQNLGRSTV